MKNSPTTKLMVTSMLAALLAASAAAGGSPTATPEADQSSNKVAVVAHPLSFKNVKTLVKAKSGDDTIIAEINETHSVFWLGASDIVKLQYAGASDKVIACMIDTSTNLVFSQPPPPRPNEDMVAAPGLEFVWVPGEWICPQNQWVWIEGGWILPPTPNGQWTESQWQQKPGGWHHIPGRWR